MNLDGMAELNDNAHGFPRCSCRMNDKVTTLRRDVSSVLMGGIHDYCSVNEMHTHTGREKEREREREIQAERQKGQSKRFR